ncbi:MAG: DUF6396 domain-containing protein [Pseudomonadota bacterium]
MPTLLPTNCDAQRSIIAALLCIPLISCKAKMDQKLEFPRDQQLPLFQPHATDFACAVEAIKLPNVDAQAEAWFLEARALEDPNSYVEKPDYEKIMRLTRQAADRRHWKAMLNLASFYIERRDPQRGALDALQLVEDAMRLGVPAAYDRMGTYFMNGTGVNADATRAYAFWQQAAKMGNPHAMAFLAEKLNAAPEWEKGGQWSNIPLAMKMFACAASQGYGNAAHDLHYLVRSPSDVTDKIDAPETVESRTRALKVLHEGVKIGCLNCANKLWVEFGHPHDLSNMLAPFIDKARSERYAVLRNALGYNNYRRFPNLDRMVPLPPAKLPPWDGTRESLLAAVMSVSPAPTPPKSSAASTAKGRYFLDAEYALRQTSTQSAEPAAPFAGYWQPTSSGLSESAKLEVASTPPGLYKAGESFDRFRTTPGEGVGALKGVVWQFWEVVRHNHGAVEPLAPAGLTSIVPRPSVDIAVPGNQLCPAEGVWQPWLPDTHPMHGATNQHWRQSWLRKGQAFPQPKDDWMLDLPTAELTWHLMEAAK